MKALEARKAPLAELHDQVWAFLSTINVYDEGKAAIGQWERVLDALRDDPDIALPA